MKHLNTNKYALRNKGDAIGCVWNVQELDFISSLDEALSWAGDF